MQFRLGRSGLSREYGRETSYHFPVIFEYSNQVTT